MEAECLTPDRISNLPSSLILTILTLVPIRDAFRTSILSRNWRYRCLKIPKLEFDDKLLTISTTNQSSSKCKVFHAIYTVLLLHIGPILEVSFCMSQLQSCCEIDQIILHLAKNATLEKFTLFMKTGNDYKLPKSFSLHRLTHLNLENCVVEPHVTIFRFKRLTNLRFNKVAITKKVLITLLSCCPVLKSFTLIQDDRHFTGSEYSDFVELSKCLPLIEHLEMNCYSAKCFASGVIPQRLPNMLVHLEVLNLSGLSFGKEDELRSALLLITSSPNIEKIKLEMYYDSTESTSQAAMNLLDLKDYSYAVLDHLCELEITNFSNSNRKPGMDFVRIDLIKIKSNLTMLELLNKKFAE